MRRLCRRPSNTSREDNETIKEGETPEDWKFKPAKTLVFRLQEPHRRRPPAQIRAPLRGERRERARQSKVRRCSRYEQHGFGRVGRQRLSQPGDRRKTRPTRPEEPHSLQGLSQSQTQ